MPDHGTGPTVLFVALGIYDRIGGMERFNQRVVRALGELEGRGLGRSTVISLWDHPQGSAPAAPAKLLPGGSSKWRTMLNFVEQVRRTRPDIILYGHILLAPLAMLARRLAPRSRQVLFVHGIEAWGAAGTPVSPLHRWAVRRQVDAVISVSRFTSRRMAQAFGLPAERFSILPNAIDLEEGLRTTNLRQPWPARLLSVTRLSRNDRYKGIDQVIRALPLILREVPEATYEIVGNGALVDELRALAEASGVSRQVRFAGYLSDEELERSYARAGVFVLPSRKEGFGIVFLEAWRRGLPVVAGNRDASQEVVTGNLNGILVDPDSRAEIAKAVVALLRGPDTARVMGQAGLETVCRRYTHPLFRERLLEILAGVAG